MLSRMPTEEEALTLLEEAGCSPRVVEHCRAVARLAFRMSSEMVENGVQVNLELVKIGALLHDLGRGRTHDIHHALEGAELARSLSLPEAIVKIIERHIGSGITPEEAAMLGLPQRSYLPSSLEEKIVTYADKLIEGSREVGFKKALKSFSTELGGFLGSPAKERFKELHRELSSLAGEANQ